MASVRRDMRGQAVFIRTTTATRPVRHVLLVSDVLIGGYQDLVTGFFRSIQQVPIGQGIPSVLPGLFDVMTEKLAPQLPGRPVIKQDSHGATLSRSSCATCSSAAFTPPIPPTPPNHSMKS